MRFHSGTEDGHIRGYRELDKYLFSESVDGTTACEARLSRGHVGRFSAIGISVIQDELEVRKASKKQGGR